MDEEKKMTAEEMVQKSKKMHEVFNSSSYMVLDEVKNMVGRDLTDEEKEKLGNSLKMHFLMTSLMMRGI